MKRRILPLVVACLLLTFVPAAATDHGHVFDHGGWRITNPVFVNIYWDRSWDALPPGGFSGLRIGRRGDFDAITQAICDSRYFDGLAEYGIAPGEFAGSFTVNATAPLSVDVSDFQKLLSDLLAAPPAGFPQTDPVRTIYNIFTPAATTDFSSAFANAYHFHVEPTAGQPHRVAFTVIPVSSVVGGAQTDCLSIPLPGMRDFVAEAQLTVSLTHEMLEAATDPAGTAWFDPEFGREIADIGDKTCQPFLCLAVDEFWSQSSRSLTMGFPGMDPPNITSVERSGSGADLLLEIHGHGFGRAPAALRNLPFIGKTLFVDVDDFDQDVDAGHLASPHTVGYQFWSDDEIDLHGIDSDAVSYKDAFALMVFRAADGASASIQLPRLIPSELRVDPFPTDLTAGPTPLTIHGHVLDQEHRGYPGDSVTWAVSNSRGESLASGTVPTGWNGQFSFDYPLLHSGTQTLGLTFGAPLPSRHYFLTVHPTITSLDPDHVPIGLVGDIKIQIHGYGLQEMDLAWFDGTSAAFDALSPDGLVFTVHAPVSPIPGNKIGWVDVVGELTGTGIRTTPTRAARICYYRPGVPVIRPPRDGFECSPALIEAVIWDEHGALWTDSTILRNIRFNADGGSFEATGADVRSWVPVRFDAGEVFADLYEGNPPVSQTQVYVQMFADESTRSGRTITFNDALCGIMQTHDRIRGLVGHEDIRAMLKEWVRPRIPRDRFAKLPGPFVAEMKLGAPPPAGSKAARTVTILVRDAKGRPIAGIPVAMLATEGLLVGKLPLLTDRSGVARAQVRPSREGNLRLVATVDEVAQPLVLREVHQAAKN